jgi:hypothetical protein
MGRNVAANSPANPPVSAKRKSLDVRGLDIAVDLNDVV